MKNKIIPKKYINKIIEGDSLEIMKKIPSNSIDLTFADPPFNLSKKYDVYNDKIEVKNYLDWCEKWIRQMVRITKTTGSIIVHNIPKWLTYFAEILNKNPNAHFKHWIAWDALSTPLGKTLLPNHYGFIWYVKSKEFKFYDIRTFHQTCRECGAFIKDYGGKKILMHDYGALLSDVWTDIHRIRHPKRRDEHPCQLPIPIMERLILMTTDENDVVLDPFIGTGTTAIASKRLNRRYIGIDIDPKYIEISKEKLIKTYPTLINDIPVSIYLNKVYTIRDIDFEIIKDFLKSRDHSINNGKIKQVSLPYVR